MERNLERDKLTDEETYLIAPCGIYCGACDIKLGRSRDLAKEMYRILDGFNFADVGFFLLGMDQEKIMEFLTILKRWSEGEQCPGCLGGGGNPACAIKACTKTRGFLTCAECESIPCKRSPDNENWLGDAAAFLELITKRYANWNIMNLERIQEIGYRRFIDETQEKVKSGFMTSDIISDEMLFTEAIKKMREQG